MRHRPQGFLPTRLRVRQPGQALGLEGKLDLFGWIDGEDGGLSPIMNHEGMGNGVIQGGSLPLIPVLILPSSPLPLRPWEARVLAETPSGLRQTVLGTRWDLG